MRHLAIILVCISSWAHGQFVNNTGIILTNSADLYTNGDWQNSGVIRNTGKITTSESWQNAGTMDVNSWGGFVLQYGEDKMFSAGANSVRMGFIQKEGMSQAVITGKIMVTDSLKILSGVIRMASSSDTLGFSSAWVYAAVGSYVEGPMARFGAGTFSFPVGLSGKYLPIKFFNSNAPRVGVVVESAPAGYTAGDGVESLPFFPYAWRTVSTSPANTTSYLEVQAPDGLFSGMPSAIVVQKVNLANEYESMGAREVSSDGVNTKVRSYSGTLNGLLSVANGYPGSMLGDSLVLVSIFDGTSGANWTNRTNWRAGFVNTWFGITAKGGRVTRVEMPNNNITGIMPATIVNMNALKVLNVATNNITSIPDFTTMPAIATLDVSANNLDFGSLESNAALIGVNYVNQDSVGTRLYTEIPVSTNYTLSVPVGGASNAYQWKHKGQPIAGANSNTYQITSINRAKMGDYVLEVTNPLVPGLTLVSSKQRVLATADISGTMLVGPTTPATAGTMRLLKVTPTGSYDTTRVQSVGSNGTYLFDNVILDDYLVNGFADTIAHPKAIPTYYVNTIFWEEADTLFVEDNVTALNIFSQFKPDPPTTGEGQITGTFYIDEESEGGRIKVKSRVKKAAVTVRRVESSGKGNEELLTLVAYLFTNDDGEFTFDKLDAHEYRLNIQLPGYPMDETSFITIPIGTTLFDRQVGVEAEVIEGKIKVKKLVITGWQEEEHAFYAYPNPTVEYLYLKGRASERDTQFQLLDMSGRVMETPAQWNEPDQRWELKINHLPIGTYFLRVHKNGKIETVQISIQ